MKPYLRKMRIGVVQKCHKATSLTVYSALAGACEYSIKRERDKGKSGDEMMEEKKNQHISERVMWAVIAFLLGAMVRVYQTNLEQWAVINRQTEILEIQSEQMTEYFEQSLQFRKLEVEFWRDYYQTH